MSQVVITGWNIGCNTVAAIKEIREKGPMPLNEALAVVNRVLNNEQVVVDVPTPAIAQALVEALSGLGLLTKCVSD
jgi:hypothetical protein